MIELIFTVLDFFLLGDRIMFYCVTFFFFRLMYKIKIFIDEEGKHFISLIQK